MGSGRTFGLFTRLTGPSLRSTGVTGGFPALLDGKCYRIEPMAHARWNRKDFDPNLLVARLEALRIPDDGSGSVGFKGDLFFEDVVSVIERATVFTVPMPESEGRRIVVRALFSAARGCPYRRLHDGEDKPRREAVCRSTPEGVRAGDERRRPILPRTRRYRRGGAQGLLRSLPSRAPPFRARNLKGTHPTLRLRRDLHQGSLLGPYTAVWVAVRGRSGYEAAAEALAALDLLRDIWNLALNRSRRSRTSSKRRTPVNGVLLGPVPSLHNPDGGLASEADWYEYETTSSRPKAMNSSDGGNTYDATRGAPGLASTGAATGPS